MIAEISKNVSGIKKNTSQIEILKIKLETLCLF
jgi:hypothetical protein